MLNVLKGAAMALGLMASPAFAGQWFDHVITVIFENTNQAAAMQQPFFKSLATRGANFTNMRAITHPSQPNYVALTSGATNGVTNDSNINLNVASIINRLELKGISWKVYAEAWPGNCFTGAWSSTDHKGYARKHNPFISYNFVRTNPARCAKIVNANTFDSDAANNRLPDWVFFIPSQTHSGHSPSNVSNADSWYDGKFSGYVNNPTFMARTVLISTFDENDSGSPNAIYTSLVGPNVKAGAVSTSLNLYSLMRLWEENFVLGNVGKNDATAPRVPTSIFQ